MPRTHPWKVSDALWKQVEPLIPSAPSHAKGGRPPIPDRQAFEAMVYLLRTAVQWNALPQELGASSTVHEPMPRNGNARASSKRFGKLV